MFQTAVYLIVIAIGVTLAIKYGSASSQKFDPEGGYHGVKVQIIEYVDDSQPGWVRCSFDDAYGKRWFVTEKVPVVTSKQLDKESKYPMLGAIPVEIVKIFLDSDQREVVTIDIGKTINVAEEGGETVFDVFSEQLVSA